MLFPVLNSSTEGGAVCPLHKSMTKKSDKLNFHQLAVLSKITDAIGELLHMSIVIVIIIIITVTSSQIHCVSLTFVREVESRVIQNESDNNKRCHKSSLNTMSYKTEHPVKHHE